MKQSYIKEDGGAFMRVTVKKLGVKKLATGEHVHSLDARKERLVEKFKELVPNCRKVTLLSELSPTVFQAHCLGPAKPGERGFESLGWYLLEVK